MYPFLHNPKEKTQQIFVFLKEIYFSIAVLFYFCHISPQIINDNTIEMLLLCGKEYPSKKGMHIYKPFLQVNVGLRYGQS